MDALMQAAQQIARQAQEAARLAAAQAEEWRRATPTERTFMGLGRFRSWLAGGGEARAGLPRGTLTPLHRNVSRFCTTGSELLRELEEIEQDWKDVQGDNSMKAALGRLVINLAEAGELSNEAMLHAREVKIEANVAYGIIERNMKEDHRAIQDADKAIQTGERNIVTAQNKLKAAKKKLEGWEGFGNGFLTAITFTAHNPIKASMNEQRSAIRTINQRIASNKLLRDQRRQHASELSAGQHAINEIYSVDQSMSRFQTCVADVTETISKAFDSVDKAENKENLKSAAFYAKQARPRMDELLGWISTFRRLT